MEGETISGGTAVKAQMIAVGMLEDLDRTSLVSSN